MYIKPSVSDTQCPVVQEWVNQDDLHRAPASKVAPPTRLRCPLSTSRVRSACGRFCIACDPLSLVSQKRFTPTVQRLVPMMSWKAREAVWKWAG